MKNGWHKFKAFWTAEEVPRWFGFSLILLYLVGLGAVGYFGMTQVREETAAYFSSSSEYAVKALADRLAALPTGEPLSPETVSAYRRGVYDFAAHVPTRWVRMRDGGGRVIVSTVPPEVGTVPENDHAEAWVPQALEVTLIEVHGQDTADRLLRLPIPLDNRHPGPGLTHDPPDVAAGQVADANAAPGGGGGPALYLEAQLLSEAPEASSLAHQAGLLTVVLVAMGVLFGLYRRLRAQLRGVFRISGRLQMHRHRIEQDLASLRITDSTGTADTVTSAWNELVDYTQDLLEAVNRTEANEELTRVLERSGGGALAEALNALPDGIIYLTDEVRFEYVNSTACRLFGWNAQEANRTPLPEAEARGVGGKTLELLREALRSSGSFEAQTVVVEPDGPDGVDHSSYRVWIVPLHRAHRDGECLVIIRDVSQQIRADRSREEFVTQVTHELRTPLTNIRAYAETLSSGMFDDPSVITECYNVITKETRRLSRLIEDILSVSQLEVGSIDLHTDSVDLKALLTEGVRDVRGLADEKNIDIQLQLPTKMEPINADRDKLAVVVNNLLGNAIKYTPSDGDVLVGFQCSGDEVVLTFKDNGIGIDPADHARVFEKFQRGNDPEVENETGTGIGLYTAREIVRRHGGDIELISRKGEGSTFMVRLPHRESRAAALSPAEEV